MDFKIRDFILAAREEELSKEELPAEEEWAEEEEWPEAEEEWVEEEEVAELTHPIYDLYIKEKSAPFSAVIRLFRGITKADSEEQRLANLRYYPQVLKAFENKWGKVHYRYVSDSNAIIFTEDCFLFHEESSPDLASLEIINQCDILGIEARRLLKGQDLYSCVYMLKENLSHLFGSMDKVYNKKKDLESHQKLVSHFSEELEKINNHFIRCAKRRAVYEYYLGMINGFSFVTVIALLLGGILNYYLVSQTIFVSVVGSLISGGIGAIVSVMQRISSKDFNPDYEAGPQHNKRIGTFRPMIGAVMGIVVYFLLMSGLLPLAVPEDASTNIFYILVISFSAGFTERWAQGMLPPFMDGPDENGEENQKNNKGQLEEPQKPEKTLKEPSKTPEIVKPLKK